MRACCTRVFSSSIQKFDCAANKDVFSNTDTDVPTYIIKLSTCLCPVHVDSHTIPATHVAPLPATHVAPPATHVAPLPATHDTCNTCCTSVLSTS